MKIRNTIKLLVVFVGLFIGFITNSNAQYVGEQSLGLTMGLGNVPLGLSYHYVVSDNSALEFHAGYTNVIRLLNDDGGENDILLGAAYQPFVHVGSKSSKSHIYLNMGIRARFHLDRFGEKKSNLSPVTPDGIFALGFLADLGGTAELFGTYGIRYFNLSYQEDYKIAEELVMGIRFQLN